MISCSKCVLPETHETIQFGADGVCNVCKNIEQKQNIDWEKKHRDLAAIIRDYRGKHDYDCIVPFSGGKDSTWTLYYLIKEFNLKVLVVRFDHGFLRPKLNQYADQSLRQLGADVLHFTPNWKTVRKLMLQSLLEKGDFCWHCHTGIFSYPMWVALQQKVPLIIWGEPSAEYTAYYSYDNDEEVDEKRFNRYINLGINAEDMHLRLGQSIDIRDMKPYTYPPLRDLRALNYRSICLGSYLQWDVEKQSKIIREKLGWDGDEVENVPSKYFYEKIECYMQGVRDYIKFLKRGYSRPSHLGSIDIRNNRMSREDVLEMVAEHEGKRPPSLDIFLEFVGLDEAEFNDIVRSHSIAPHIPDLENIKPGKKTWDFDLWRRGDGLPEREAQDMLQRWAKNSEG